MAYPDTVRSRIGVRRRDEIELWNNHWAHLMGEGLRCTFSHGALVGFRWILGYSAIGPVTMTERMGSDHPCVAQLYAEEQAASVQLRRWSVGDRPGCSLVHGSHSVLAWVCGRVDDPPSGTTHLRLGEEIHSYSSREW